MTQEIDYIAEVKKFYPDAICYMPEFFDVYVVKEAKGIRGDIGKAYFETGAWKSAYDNLKQQGKL